MRPGVRRSALLQVARLGQSRTGRALSGRRFCGRNTTLMCWLAWIAVVSCSLRTRPTREPTTVSSSATGGWSSKERRRSEDDRFPIYFKTGNHSLKDRQHAEDEGYVVFDRTDFLRILATYRGTNSIPLDFCRHLKRWQRETDSFRKWTRDGKRTSRGWDGFYRHIEESSLVGYEGDWGPLTTRVGSYWGYGIEPAETRAGTASLRSGSKRTRSVSACTVRREEYRRVG